jgi:ABC-2 type transport system permease protein
MRVLAAHVRAQTVELARYPAFAVPTLLFPALFFLLFGLPRAGGRASVLTASFAGYAVLSVAFFQFGVGIAGERTRPWELFLRALPVGVGTRLAARAISATVFATASVGVVIAVALATTDVDLGARSWARVGVALLAGSVPFTLLGIALGYWLPPKGALPVANILYLALSYAGGLWTGPTGLPALVTRISGVLPTRIWGDLLWPAALGGPWSLGPWARLTGYAAAFGVLAVWGYRRDDGQRFR